jgi:hypothetical protein
LYVPPIAPWTDPKTDAERMLALYNRNY